MYVLGIDIGTTSVKVALNQDNECVFSKNIDTNSFVESNPKNIHEQSVDKIFNAIQIGLSNIDEVKLKSIEYVGVSGQMHGVVFWNGSSDWSNLVTWMDQRCDNSFIDQLPVMPSNIIGDMKVSTGYGCATIFHYLMHDSAFLEKWTFSGNIVDLFVSLICGNNRSIMSPQMAHSWGYFDIVNDCWFTDILTKYNFPVRLLPEIVPTGTLLGNCKDNLFGLPMTAKVFVGMGDLQCSMFLACKEPLFAAINFSTSSQFAIRLTKDQLYSLKMSSSNANEELSKSLANGKLVINPIGHQNSGNDFLLVACSLNGGNVLSEFVNVLQAWTEEISGINVPFDKIWSNLISSKPSNKNPSSQINISPTLFGERFDTQLKASISNISCNTDSDSSLSVYSVYDSLCLGLIQNLYNMLGCDIIRELGVKELTCSGGVVRRHPVVDKYIRKFYGPPLIPNVNVLKEYDACMGAIDSILSIIF